MVLTANVIRGLTGGIDANAITFGTLSNARLPSVISGNGNGLMSLSASNISTGIIDNARLPSTITANFVGNAQGLSELNIANVSIGILPVDRGGTGAATSTGNGNVVLSNGATLTNIVIISGDIDASNVTSGTLANARLPSDISVEGNVQGAYFIGNGVSISNGIIPMTILQANVQSLYGAWTSRTSPANTSNNQWTSVCYGNGLFVAVCRNNAYRVMTSPDGITWTSRIAPQTGTWFGVCYGNGLYVAVGYQPSYGVMTSPDSITWTTQTSPLNTNEWRSVCYGNGLFVAVSSSGTGNRVMTSPDGITWTSRTSAANNDWNSVCYGADKFVAVSYSGTGNRVMTSPDGITWTSRTSAGDNSWSSVCYGNGLFVAVSYTGNGNRVMSSPDGITWTSRTSAVDNQWMSVCWGVDKFVAVSYDGTGNRVMTSPDGITWTTEASAANNGWYGVCWGADKFVAVSYTGTGTTNQVMTSTGTFTPSLGLGRTAGTGYQIDLSLDTARKLTTTTWTTGSDRRIKEEIEDANLDMCVELVETIPLKRFAWKTSYAPNQDDRHQLGWIAQDVEEAGLEKAVTISEDHGYPDFRSLNTDQLYKVMWGALQKNITEVKELKARLDMLQ